MCNFSFLVCETFYFAGFSVSSVGKQDLRTNATCYVKVFGTWSVNMTKAQEIGNSSQMNKKKKNTLFYLHIKM
mgnify:CR=1 FL=1